MIRLGVAVVVMSTIFMVLGRPAGAADPQTCSTLLLVVEQDGRVSDGSKARLAAAVNGGLPLRVSWSLDADGDGKADLVHWADAIFVTQFEGEVFAQIADIRRQIPRRADRHVELSPAPVRWTGSIGSDGILEGAFDNDEKPTRTHVRTTFCVDPRVPRDNVPLTVSKRR